MDLDANQLYDARTLWVFYDLRDPEAVKALHRARRVWRHFSDVEVLDEDHRLLTLRPGGALDISA